MVFLPRPSPPFQRFLQHYLRAHRLLRVHERVSTERVNPFDRVMPNTASRRDGYGRWRLHPPYNWSVKRPLTWQAWLKTPGAGNSPAPAHDVKCLAGFLLMTDYRSLITVPSLRINTLPAAHTENAIKAGFQIRQDRAVIRVAKVRDESHVGVSCRSGGRPITRHVGERKRGTERYSRKRAATIIHQAR